MPVLAATEARRHETPNAVMSTLASPTLGGATLALWRVEMAPGARGPDHVFDVEQVWTVTAGGADVTIEGETQSVASGDTLVLPAGAVRQIVATGEGFAALAAAPAGARALLADGTDRGTPPWIA
jgi:quercetin dioxygenase-like cupin family protein